MIRPVRALAIAALLAIATWTSGIAAAPPASVVFAHINDVYEIDAVENGAFGGMARVATVIDRLRRAGPPVLATLGGDFLSPSALGTARINNEPLAGQQMVDVLNAIGLQYATLGNHEFDLSEAAFRKRLTEAKFKIIASNVTDQNDAPFPGVLTSTIASVKHNTRTLRIGFIGLVIDATKKPWVKYSPPVDAAKIQVAALRGKVDAIVALTHLALQQDQTVAEAVPEIDLILGGHEHENWLMRRGARLTPIVKADANGRTVAVVTLRFGASGRPEASIALQTVDARVPFQTRAQALVRRWVNTAFDAFRKDGFEPEQLVVTTPEPLDGREAVVRNRPSNLTSLILDGMLHEAGGADAAVLNGGSIRIDDVLPAGAVRQYDVIRILPFGGRILKARLSGALLAQLMDAGLANAGTGGFLQVSGVTQDRGSWLIAGKAIDPAGSYTLALPEFLLTGGEARMAFLTRTNPQVRDVQEFGDIRQAVIAELRARYPAR